jgi:hypothetical protein
VNRSHATPRRIEDASALAEELCDTRPATHAPRREGASAAAILRHGPADRVKVFGRKLLNGKDCLTSDGRAARMRALSRLSVPW